MNASDARERLLLEGARLFGSKGYGSTSVRELVEAAGVTKPTLYYYFESKEGLFVAIANRLLEHMDALACETLAGPAPLVERLERLLLANVELAAHNPDAVRFLMTAMHQVDHGQPQIDLMAMDATIVRYLAVVFTEAQASGELRTDIDVPLAVISFLGVVRAWSLAAFHGAPVPPDFHRTLVHQYLYGIVPS